MAEHASTDPLTLARAAFARADHAAAARHARERLARVPDDAAALLLLANACIAQRDDDGALAALVVLQRLRPESEPVRRTLADAYNRVAAAARRRGDEHAAADGFARALMLEPRHRAAGYNLALCLRAQGRHEAALTQLTVHLEAHPDDLEARLDRLHWQGPGVDTSAGLADLVRRDLPPALRARLVRIAAELDSPAIAADALAALDPAPAVATALDASDLLRAAGNIDGARQLARQALERGGRGRVAPALQGALRDALALPPIMRSRASIEADRQRIAQALVQLDAAWDTRFLARCEPALEQLAWSNFHLAYHGQNDRELQAPFGRLIRRAAAHFAPQLAAPARAGVGRRIGLLSSSWRDCTVGAYFGGWIGWLRDAGFEVVLYQLGPRRDARTDRLAAQADRFRFLDAPLRDVARTLRDDTLDLLLYPELGMDARLIPLAALRLAPIQVAAWGHPDTSGLDSIDAWLSCADMEPGAAQQHYVEPLHLLPGLGVDYARPPLPPPATRASLGLPDAVPLLLVPQSLFKLHPDNDEVLATIAAQVPRLRIVLFEGEHPRWRRQFEARIAAAFDAAGVAASSVLLWQPLVPRARYLQINRACDLMLDSLAWSGGNTSLDALGCGLPLLTVRGGSMRARQSAAMLDRLGLAAESVLPDAGALAARAVELLCDPEARRGLSQRIIGNLDALFDPQAARLALPRLLRALRPSG